MDYQKIRLRCGIEIHQELATRHKLFCRCPPKLGEKPPEYTFTRKLRPSQSELGEVDPAALFEFKKGKIISYEGSQETNCLVEMDEEPPGPLDAEALDLTLSFALLVGSRPVDEVHVMRKTVVDGSNTGGFQRTCLVTFGGAVQVAGKTYRLNQICLEEDAARNVGEEGDTVRYNLDRLGIPLMEVTTAPDMHEPAEVAAVAQRIGGILRATGRVRRGIGTIRQDLNVSVMDGPVVEIKGVQTLDLIPTIIEYEARRQAALLEVAEELKRRGASPDGIDGAQFDVSEVFEATECKIIRNALKAGGVVLAVKLPGLLGLTGRELCPGRRLGTEMSDHAKYRGGVRGLFHTDELPGYSVTQAEVDALRALVGAGEGDAVVIVADAEDRCRRALEAVADRARDAFTGVPLETRSSNPDGTTRFTRPRPGAARMYPETDVRAITITPGHIEKLRAGLPEMPETKLERFQRDYGLNDKLARQIVDSEYTPLFEEFAAGHPRQSTLAAVTLTEDLKKLQRDGAPVDRLTDETLSETLNMVASGETVKESLIPLLAWLSANPSKTPREGLTSLGLGLVSEAALAAVVEAKIKGNTDLVSRLGDKAEGPLMGIVMAEVRGKAKAPDVQAMIKRKLAELKP